MKNKLILPISLLIISLGIYTYIQKNTVRRKQNTLSFSWETYRKDMLSTMIISEYSNANEMTYTLAKENGIWSLTEPVSVTIFPEKALALANSFLTLNPRSIISNISAEDMATYGLANPNFKVLGVFNGNTNGFVVGGATAVGEQYYVMDINSTNNAYLVSRTQITPFIHGVFPLINNNFLTRSTDDIQEVTILNSSKERISLSNVDRFWVQNYPTTNNQVDWGTRKFLLSLKVLNFETNSIVIRHTPAQLQSLGINQNSPYVQLVFNDQTTNFISIGNITQGVYPVFVSNENILAFTKADTIHAVFGTTLRDFQNQRENQ